MTITLQQLDALAEKHLSLPPAPPEPKPITRRDARQQVLGAIKIIARMSGMSMVTDVHPTELLVQRIDELEAQSAAKDAHIARLEKALANASAVLELYADDPFELKPISKWNKGELGKWMLAAMESIKWVVTRAENELDQAHAVPLIAGPKD